MGGGIDPRIALGVQVPQVEGPIDLQKGALSVQQLINATQLQKQQQAAMQLQQQQQQIELKQQQYQLQDQETLRTLAPQFVSKDENGNGTFDFDGLAQAAQARGVNPQTINKLRMENFQMQEAATKLGSEKLTNELAHNKAAYEVLEGVKGITDPDQRLTAAATGINRLKAMGVKGIDGINPSDLLDDKKLESFETQLGMHGQVISDAKMLAETNEKNAEAESKQWEKFPELGVIVNTKTGEQRQVAGTNGLMTPAMQESKYLNIEQKKNLGQPLAPDEAAYKKAYEHYKELVPAFNINAQLTGGGLGPTGGGGPTPPALAGGPGAAPQAQNAPGGWVTPQGKTLNNVPGAIRGEVQQVLEYRRADPSITQRGLVGQAINSWVSELDPQHDATTFPAKNKILGEYTKDASTGQIGAINTALGHLGELQVAAQALDKNDLPLLHSIASKLGLATGSDAPSTYQMILHRVGPEMTSAYVKGGGGQGERGANQEDFDLNKGQKQILSNIAESAQLLNSKLASKKQDWDQTFRPYRDADQFENRFLTPDAKKTLANLSAQAPTNKAQHVPGGQAQGLKEGQTGTGSDGKKYIVKGGVWTPQ